MWISRMDNNALQLGRGRYLHGSMVLRSAAFIAILFWGGPSVAEQSSDSASKAPASPRSARNATTNTDVSVQRHDVSILSDTRGVDFAPYVTRITHMIYGTWVTRMQQDARPPSLIKGVTVIRFTINQNGKLTAMHLDGSTHTDSLNRAAWGAITGVEQFPPLPKEFTGPDLELRVRFNVNQPKSNVSVEQSSKHADR